MTIRYKLFGIPGNLDEFLDRETREYNNKELKVKVKTNQSSPDYFGGDATEIVGIDFIRKVEVYLMSPNEERKIKVKKYETYWANKIPEIDAKLAEDKSKLIKMLLGKSFSVMNVEH